MDLLTAPFMSKIIYKERERGHFCEGTSAQVEAGAEKLCDDRRSGAQVL